MKRLLVAIGLFLFPLSMHAKALSPWVQEVLNRADLALQAADNLPISGVCDDVTIIAEIKNNLDMARKAQTAVVALEAEANSLRERTVCYEYDRRLLQDKMNRILLNINSAVYTCKLGKSRSLRSVYEFLVDTYASFLFGGANPTYKDERLKYRYPFEDHSLSEQVYESGSTMPVCAYTTDYSPHALGYVPTGIGDAALLGTSSFDIKSYGCDETVLATIAPPFDAEAQPLRTFMQKTDSFARNLYTTVSRALLDMDEFLSETSNQAQVSLPAPLPPAPHEKISGCLRPLIPPSDPSSSFAWENFLLTFPEHFDPDKGNKDPVTGAIDFNPTLGQILPVGLLFQPTTDYFRTMRASSILTRSFLDRRIDAGVSRPLPVAFVNQKLDSYVSVLSRKIDSNQTLQYISANIEEEMAYLDLVSRDSVDAMAEASKPLTSAVDSLVEVVTEFLPKEYIPDLTFFLARSCVDGHCQQTLDAVAKRIFNPYCIPYTSGEFMEEDTQKRCFCDASLAGSWGEYEKYCTANGERSSKETTYYEGCREE